MAKWEVEVVFEPTGTYMNFEYETDSEIEDDVFIEIANHLSIVPNLVELNEKKQQLKIEEIYGSRREIGIMVNL